MKPAEAEERYIAILRAMSGNQRVKIGAELYEMARSIVASSIKINTLTSRDRNYRTSCGRECTHDSGRGVEEGHYRL